LFAILADNSQGLQIKDRGETRSRGEVLRELLNPQKQAWQMALEENFDLRRYFFDSRLQSSRDWSELAFDGRGNGDWFQFANGGERYRNRPWPGFCCSLTAMRLICMGCLI